MQQIIFNANLASKKSTKLGLISWALYDWANSSFSTIITTFIFATYFTEKIALNQIIGTEQWGFTIALSSLFIAVMSPILGAIADNEGRRKPWLTFFALMCIIASALLWFSKPDHEYTIWTLSWVIVGTIGIEMSMVFYNAMLKDIAPPGYVGRVSGWAWGLGYMGGLASLIVALLLFVDGKPTWFGLNTVQYEQVRACGPLVAAWYSFFGWPILAFTPDLPSKGIGLVRAIRSGLRTLYHTFLSMGNYKEIIKFLIAHILYVDGLNTIFAFGGIYAAGTFHMSIDQVIKFGIALNVGAGIGAAAFAWMDDYVGSKGTILFTLGLMILSGTSMLLVTSQLWFWILGIILSLCVGPIQSASRSLLVHLAPKQKITEMFGLYAFSGRITAFLGPWILGIVTYLSKSQRVGMSTIMVFLLGGTILLATVRVKQAGK